MATLLTILFWVFVASLVVLSMVLATPVRLRFHLRTSPRLTYHLDACVLGGLLPCVKVIDSLRPREPKAKKQTRARKAGRGRQLFGRGNMMSEIPGLVSGLIRAFQFEYLRANLEVGLNDPADTGQLYGCLAPLQYGCSPARGVSILVRPNFERACFAGEMDASVRIRAASFLPPITRFIWNVFGPGK